MGTRSYIVRGKGNAASWTSCSHGAGRRHSRTKAKKLFTTADLAEQMKGKVWLAEAGGTRSSTRSPPAYKDIDQVMADQADLVEVLHTLHQVLNYKGPDARSPVGPGAPAGEVLKEGRSGRKGEAAGSIPAAVPDSANPVLKL